MLTREEANKLLGFFERLDNYVTKYVAMVKGGVYFDLEAKNLKNYIESLTEKPKREIKVGDIFLNGKNQIIKIISPCQWRENSYAAFVCDNGWSYYKDGLRATMNDDRSYDLDLSKRYKLVEIGEEKC